MPFSLSSSCFNTCKKYLDKVLSVPIDDIYASYKDDNYFGKGSREAFAEVQLKRLREEGPAFLWHMGDICEKEGNKLLAYTNTLYASDVSQKSHTHIAGVLMEISDRQRAFSVFLLYVLSLDAFLDSELSRIIKKYVTDSRDILEWKKVLSEPIKLNEGQFEQLSLLKILSSIGDKKDITGENKLLLKGIQDHLKRFSWLSLRWLIGKPPSSKDIMERMEHLFDIGEIPEKIKMLEHKPAEVEKLAEEFIKKFSVEETDRKMIYMVKEYVYLRTYRTDVINQALFHTIPFLEEAAKRLSISYAEILYLSPEEISESLRVGKLLSKIRIDERKKSWALFRDVGGLLILQGKDADEFAQIQDFINEDLKDIKEISGQVGFAGKVQGIVKVVLTPHDIDKVKRGDILVTVMTFPSYIAAMEKASAFITDEGGILCHAAIVAREMKKPCVISTKIATKVLKDGDSVEVDANNGIVKVLKRTE